MERERMLGIPEHQDLIDDQDDIDVEDNDQDDIDVGDNDQDDIDVGDNVDEHGDEADPDDGEGFKGVLHRNEPI